MKLKDNSNVKFIHATPWSDPEDSYTAIPKGEDPGDMPDPTEPRILPWSEEANSMFIDMVRQAFKDLSLPDKQLRDGSICSLAGDALNWLEDGAPMYFEDGKSVSIIEGWGWRLDRVIAKAKALYDARPAMAPYDTPKLKAARLRQAEFSKKSRAKHGTPPAKETT